MTTANTTCVFTPEQIQLACPSFVRHACLDRDPYELKLREGEDGAERCLCGVTFLAH